MGTSFALGPVAPRRPTDSDLPMRHTLATLGGHVMREAQ